MKEYDSSISDIIIEHYRAMREEKMERMKWRDKYIAMFLLASAAIISAFFQNEKLWGLVLLVPILSLSVGVMYSYTDMTIGAISKWLCYEHSATLKNYLDSKNVNYELSHWDNSAIQKEYSSSVHFSARHIAISIFIATPGIISAFIVSDKLINNFNYTYYLIILLSVLMSLVGAIYPLYVVLQRRKETKVVEQKS